MIVHNPDEDAQDDDAHDDNMMSLLKMIAMKWWNWILDAEMLDLKH